MTTRTFIQIETTRSQRKQYKALATKRGQTLSGMVRCLIERELTEQAKQDTQAKEQPK